MTAPTNEIGYAQIPIMSVSGTSSAQWWMYEDETTPELRWPQSVFVYDQMRRQDSQVVSVLRAVTLPVRRTPWRIDPAGARDEVVQLVAEDLGLPIVGREMEPLQRTRDRFSWSDHLREALLMLPFGHSYFEQLYRIVEDRARLRKLAVRMPKTIENIEVARDGGLVSIKQYAMGGGVAEVPIPVNRLVAYIHEGESGNWLGTSLLRPAYKNWLLKDRLLRVQAQTIERNGMGIPVYEAAETERKEDMAVGLKLATSLRSGDAAGARIPFGAKLKLMGVDGQLPDAEPAIRYHDEQIGRAVLAHFLNLGTQTGSWALGSTFADFFTLSLQTLAQQIADVATQHIVEDLVDLNFGEGEPAPKIVHDEIGSRQAATAEAIRALIDAGVITPDEVLERAVRQQFGLPPKDPNADPAPEPEEDFEEPSEVFASADLGAGSDVDDDPIGELDDDTLILLQAMYEIEVERGLVLAAWDPGLHKRWPKGHPKAGKFKPMVDLLKEAIRKHDSKGHPFDNFKREQLLKAAKVRGIALKRGEDKESIAAKLFADLAIGKAKVPAPAPAPAKKKAVPAKKAAKKVAAPKVPEFKLEPADQKRVHVIPFAGGPWISKKESFQVRVNKGLGNIQIGAVHREQDDTWTALPIGGGEMFFKAPKKATRDQAIKALLDAHDAAEAANKAKLAAPKGNRLDEVKAKIEQDRLEELDYLDLKDLAFEHGVDVVGRSRENIIADIRKEIAAGGKAAAKAKPAKAKVPVRNVAGPAGRFHRSVKGIEDLQKTVESSAVVEEKRLAGGAIGDTRLRKHADGRQVVWKRTNSVGENDAEQLASMLARALGLHAPRIYRNKEDEVNMDFIEGDVAIDVLGRHDVVAVPDHITDTNEGRMMGLLDQLIANADRHNGNWMIRSDKRLVPIDHGFAFGNAGRPMRDGGKASHVRSGFGEHYSTQVLGKGWLPNDLTKGDIAQLRKRIVALHPDFEHLGRGDWHQFMLDRLDAIGQHATGTKSRLLPPVV